MRHGIVSISYLDFVIQPAAVCVRVTRFVLSLAAVLAFRGVTLLSSCAVCLLTV